MKLVRNYLYPILYIIVFLAISISCSEEIDQINVSTDEIVFHAVPTKGWIEFGSRGEEHPETLVHASVTEGICESYSQPIYLHTVVSEIETMASSIDDIIISRSQPVTSPYETIGVTGVYNGPTNEESFLMRDEKISSPFNKTGRYWPNGAGDVVFYAHSPYSSANTQELSASYPELSYVVPAEPEKQIDLLIGKSETFNLPEDKGKIVELPLYHALTAVQFVASPSFEPGYIESMTVNNVSDSAIFDYETFSWNLKNSHKSFCVNFNEHNPVGVDTTELFTKEKTLLMLPQTFTDKNSALEIEIVFYDKLPSQNKHTVKFILNDDWKPNTKVKYCISTNPQLIERIFETDLPAVSKFKYDGSSKDESKFNFYINSYAVYADENGEHYEELSYDEPQFPDWIILKKKYRYVSNIDPNSKKGVGCYKYEFEILENVDYIDIDTHGEKLRKTVPLFGIRNLSDNKSLSNDIINTANCYVINAPGNYKLPLILGNGYKNGIVNNEAFKYLTDSELGTYKNIYSPITDYNGNVISNPVISNAEKVFILWQDSYNLVSNVSLCDNNLWIKFEISEDNITQGNAVIAVLDKNDTIIWSWHIWVTDLDINDASNKIQIDDFTFLCDNIGWCDGKSRNYQEKKFDFCLNQQMSGRTIIKSFIQEAECITQKGNSTYYQWGRKDPFPGMSNYDIRKTTYDGIVKAHPDETSHGEGYGYAEMIKNPNVFFSFGHHSWFYFDETEVRNKIPWTAWNSSAFDPKNKYNQHTVLRLTTTKSIYDPCPIGFKVPPVGVYNKIKNSLYWDSSIMAYTISNTNKTLYFYALGYLVANKSNGIVGNLWQAGTGNREHLRYWTTEIYTGIEAEHLCHKAGENNVHAENSFISQGFPIKAVVDE